MTRDELRQLEPLIRRILSDSVSGMGIYLVDLERDNGREYSAVRLTDETDTGPTARLKDWFDAVWHMAQDQMREQAEAERARVETERKAECAKFAVLNRILEISAELGHAGWGVGIEYALWAMVQGGDRHFGLGEVSRAEVSQLRQDAEVGGGWWRWDEDKSEVFVPMAEWLAMYAARQAKAP